jgi:hypothetical protein
MRSLVVLLVVSIVGLSALVSAGPTLISLADAAVPLVIAVGIVVGVLRLIWHYTSRY